MVEQQKTLSHNKNFRSLVFFFDFWVFFLFFFFAFFKFSFNLFFCALNYIYYLYYFIYFYTQKYFFVLIFVFFCFFKFYFIIFIYFESQKIKSIIWKIGKYEYLIMRVKFHYKLFFESNNYKLWFSCLKIIENLSVYLIKLKNIKKRKRTKKVYFSCICVFVLTSI